MTCAAKHEHFHGTQGSHQCYMAGKCRCAPCVRSHATYLRLRRRLAGADSKVSALGAQRRIHGLAVMGWSQQQIADRAGLPVIRVNSISAGSASTILLSTHRKIVRVARDLDGVRAPANSGSVRCVNRARAAGFAPLAAWDDIDDPNDTPKGFRVPQSGRPRVDVELIERLWREGLNDREIAERMGCNYRSVFRVRKRMGWETKWAA